MAKDTNRKMHKMHKIQWTRTRPPTHTQTVSKMQRQATPETPKTPEILTPPTAPNTPPVITALLCEGCRCVSLSKTDSRRCLTPSPSCSSSRGCRDTIVITSTPADGVGGKETKRAEMGRGGECMQSKHCKYRTSSKQLLFWEEALNTCFRRGGGMGKVGTCVRHSAFDRGL